MRVEDFLKHDLSRRQFLGHSAQNAAGMAAGVVTLAGTVAPASANDVVQVGVIGLRNHGQRLATSLAVLPDVRVRALCDIDQRILGDVADSVDRAAGHRPQTEVDFRRLLDDPGLDAVVIATPDHWHAVMAIMACQAEKDVYLEKPIGHNVDECHRIVEAVGKHERVVQTGLQQRSGQHFQSAIDFVQRGELGTVRLAKAWATYRRKPIQKKADSAPPQSANYDMWLGPAAKRGFNPNRFHYNWRWYWDYGCGELGNWGPHMLDVARWGLGVDLPTRVSSSGGAYYWHDDPETPDTQVVQFTYPGKTIIWEHRVWSSRGIEGRNAAAAFYGDRGTLIVDRSGWKVYERKDAVASASQEQLLPSHLRNFVDCVRTRETPAADITTGHFAAMHCHLGNIAFRLGRDVAFDPTDGFGADVDACALQARTYRSPWELPVV